MKGLIGLTCKPGLYGKAGHFGLLVKWNERVANRMLSAGTKKWTNTSFVIVRRRVPRAAEAFATTIVSLKATTKSTLCVIATIGGN